MKKDVNIEIRNSLLKHFKEEVEVTSENKWIFSIIPEFMRTFNEFNCKLYLVDTGKMYNTAYTLCTKKDRSYSKISKEITWNAIKDIFEKVYPVKNLYSQDDKAPGKYKEYTFKEVKEIDLNYIKWLYGATKDDGLKEMLHNLLYNNI